MGSLALGGADTSHGMGGVVMGGRERERERERERPSGRLGYLDGTGPMYDLPSSISDADSGASSGSSEGSMGGLILPSSTGMSSNKGKSAEAVREDEWRARMQAKADAEAKLEAYRAELEAEYAAKEAEVEASIKAQMAELESRSEAELKEHYDALEKARKDKAAALEAEAKAIEAKTASELEAIEAKAAASVKEREADMRTASRLAQVKHEEELAKLRTKWQNEQAALRAAELDRIRAQHEAQLGEEKAKLEAKLETELESQAAEVSSERERVLQSKIESLEAKLSSAKASVAQLSSSLADREAQMEELSKARDEAQAQAAEAASAVLRAQREVDTTPIDNGDSGAAAAEALAALEEAKAVAAELDAKVASLESERALLSAQVESSASELVSLKNAYEVAQVKYGENAKELNARLAELTEALTEARMEAAQTKSNAAMAESAFKDAESKMKAELIGLQGQLQVAQTAGSSGESEGVGEAERVRLGLEARIQSLEAELELARQAESRRRDEAMDLKRASLLYQSNLQSQISALSGRPLARSGRPQERRQQEGPGSLPFSQVGTGGVDQLQGSEAAFSHYMSHGFQDSDSEDAHGKMGGVGSEPDGSSAGEMLREELETLEAAVAEEKATLAKVKAEVKAQNAQLKKKARWLESQRRAWKEDAAEGREPGVLAQVKSKLETLATELNRDAEYVKASKAWVKLSEERVDLMNSTLDESRSVLGGEEDADEVDAAVVEELVRVSEEISQLASVLKRGAPVVPPRRKQQQQHHQRRQGFEVYGGGVENIEMTPRARRGRARTAEHVPALAIRTPGGSLLELKWSTRLDSACAGGRNDRARLASFLRGVTSWSERANTTAFALAKHANWLDRMKEVVRVEESAHMQALLRRRSART